VNVGIDLKYQGLVGATKPISVYRYTLRQINKELSGARNLG
jgi:hypothetical protein